MHFDGWGVFFVHKKKPKIFRSISQVKGKVSQKVFLEKGWVLQKVFSVFWYYEERFKLFWVAYQVWKKEVFKSKISVLSLNCITMLDLNLEPFAILLQLATGPVEGRSLGQPFGDVVWSLHHCATAFAEANSFRNQKTTPHTMSKYDHHVRWELNTKCKLVIIIYPGPTSKQPWLRDLKEARI